MRVIVAVLLFLMVAEAVAAPAPFPRPKAFEIDFTPLESLPAGSYNWSMDITIVSKKGKTDVLTFTGGIAKPAEPRHMVLQLRDPLLKWPEVDIDKSGKRLIVKRCYGAPPRSVEVSLAGLDQSYKPKVHRQVK
jgi:hypothetical protein